MSSQSEATISSITRHPEYYFPDGSVVLQVEDVLFKVRACRVIPLYKTALTIVVSQIQASLLTQESETFRDMFALPAAQHPHNEDPEHEDSAEEGSCDENPILIPEVTSLAFEHFLFMFYGR